MKILKVLNDSKCEIGNYQLIANDDDISSAMIRCIQNNGLVFEMGDTIRLEECWSEEDFEAELKEIGDRV